MWKWMAMLTLIDAKQHIIMKSEYFWYTSYFGTSVHIGPSMELSQSSRYFYTFNFEWTESHIQGVGILFFVYAFIIHTKIQ